MSHRKRSGFTMIEVMVVLGVIGLLMSLLLPAIQAARASARRASCKNNVRQILVAVHNFVDLKKHLPGRLPGAYFHGSILPQLEANRETIRLSIFACPSDPLSEGNWREIIQSYLGNNGTGGFYSGNGVLGEGKVFVKPRDVTDGLSNTAALSERLTNNNRDSNSVPSSDRRRAIQRSEGPYESLDKIRRACEVGGELVRNAEAKFYTHIMPPNGNSCTNGRITSFEPRRGRPFSASSLHDGGVNLGLCDGSCRFINDSIDSTVWMAIGTRAGSESLGEF